MIEDLIADTFDFIEEQIKTAVSPAIAWSAGKDSQVLLYFAVTIQPEIPIIYFRALNHPAKHSFMERIAQEWNLNLIIPSPIGRDVLQAENGRIEIIEVYQVGANQTMYFPVEAEPGFVPDAAAICGRKHLEDGPISCAVPDRDAIFIGHRGDDADPTHGQVPLKSYVAEDRGFKYVYPLKDWTEAEIWEASNILSIPQNEARYRRGEMEANADYYPLCTGCLRAGAPGETVRCPQTQTMVPLLPAEINPEANRAAWRAAFVNIA